LSASRQDGERRSSTAAATLLEDAGSPAAAFFGRHSGGLKATKANATGNTQGPGHLHDEPLRRAATLPCAVDAGRQNQRARLVIEVILDPKRPCLDQERPPQAEA